jgi:hypothetical protein
VDLWEIFPSHHFFSLNTAKHDINHDGSKTAPSTMDRQPPEMELIMDCMHLRTRIEELPPLSPSATPRQQGYRDILQDVLSTLPSSIPGEENPTSDSDSDDAGQDDGLNLLVCLSLERFA